MRVIYLFYRCAPTPPKNRTHITKNQLRKNIIATFSGFSFTVFAIGCLDAWTTANAQNWSNLNMGWLALDYWSQIHQWKAGVVGACLTFLLASLASWASQPYALIQFIKYMAYWTSKPAISLGIFAAAYLLPLCASKITQPAAPINAPNILFVLIDTWRADHAGFLGYSRPVSPGLDTLAQKGAIFEAGVAQSGWTKPTVATLFTGLLPSSHGAVSQPIPNMSVHGTKLPADRTTFIELFRANGWETGMWSNNPNILPQHGFAQGAAYFRDFVKESNGEKFNAGRAERMLPEVEKWLENQHRKNTKPFCAYVHIMDPHYPYVAPKPFAGTFDKSGLDFQLNGTVIGEFLEGKRLASSVTPEMLQRIIDIYDEELLYVDYYLTPFLEKIQKQHPNTIIVLVGDHGEEFLEHGHFGHGHSLYRELVNVPLVLIGPNIPKNFKTSQIARQMDVFPTLMELAGIINSKISAQIQGESLVSILQGKTPNRLAPMESGGDQRPPWHWRGITDGTWKMIMREKDLPSKKPIPILSKHEHKEKAPWQVLFDLKADPTEQKDVGSKNPDQLRRLYKTLQDNKWLVPPSFIFNLGASSGDLGASLELLQELGYAEANE